MVLPNNSTSTGTGWISRSRPGPSTIKACEGASKTTGVSHAREFKGRVLGPVREEQRSKYKGPVLDGPKERGVRMEEVRKRREKVDT